MIHQQLFFQVIHSLVMMKDIKSQTLTSPTDNHLSLLLSSKQLLNTILTSRNLHMYLFVLYKVTLIFFFLSPRKTIAFLHSSETSSFPQKERMNGLVYGHISAAIPQQLKFHHLNH
jgi:hypothetical protein